MAIINPHWYAQNETRKYPLADEATARNNEGIVLPSDLIVDLSLRFPRSLGTTAILSAISSREGLITVVFGVMKAPVLQSTYGMPIEQEIVVQPIASVTLADGVTGYRMVALTPWQPGVGGWIVFGSGAGRKEYSGSFSDPEQAAICLKAARPYRAAHVTGLGAENDSAPLTGDIEIVGDSDLLQVTTETLTIDSEARQAIVIAVADGQKENGLRVLSGPTGARPESGTCETPPVETINFVSPDCNGRITLKFIGCADVRAVAGSSSQAVIECPLSLDNACGPHPLITRNGDIGLPIDQCESVTGPPPYGDSPPVMTVMLPAETVAPSPGDFRVFQGSVVRTFGELPIRTGNALSIAYWSPLLTSFGRTFATKVQYESKVDGVGIIAAAGSLSGSNKALGIAAIIRPKEKRLGIYRVTSAGLRIVSVTEFHPKPGVPIDIRLTITPIDIRHVKVRAEASQEIAASIELKLSRAGFAKDAGRYGIIADGAALFTVPEVTDAESP